MVSDAASSSRQWLLRLCKVLVVALLAWGVSSTLHKALVDLKGRSLHLDFRWLAVAGAIYLAGMLPSGIFWHGILRAMGQRPTLAQTLRAFYIGHLGKYVPGKAMVLVVRAGLLRRGGVDPAVAAVSIFLETLTMMAVGAFMAALMLVLVVPQESWLLLLALGLLLGSGLPTLLPVFRRLARRVPARFVGPGFHDALEQISLKLVIGGWLGVACGWVLIGLSLGAVLQSLGVESLDPVVQLPLWTASVALAVVAGFLSLIPGGLLVRDAILMQLLDQRFEAGIAVVAALLLRLVWLVAELVISGILYYAFDRDPGV